MSEDPSPLIIRSEQPTDIPAIRAVVSEAFGQTDEAELVDTLREFGVLVTSEVAVVGGEIVGHASLSEGRIGASRILVLAPVSVVSAWQRRGVGSRLVNHILSGAGDTPVTVLGDPDYYKRFGFAPSHAFGITDPFTADSEAPQILNGEGAEPGAIEYPPAFNTL